MHWVAKREFREYQIGLQHEELEIFWQAVGKKKCNDSVNKIVELIFYALMSKLQSNVVIVICVIMESKM